jgi:hypothetical protein
VSLQNNGSFASVRSLSARHDLSDEPPLDAAKVTSVGFLIADKQNGPFRLVIRWVHASLATP